MNDSALVPLLLTKKDTAKLLSVSIRTVTKLAAAGKLKKVQAGSVKDVRFKRREVLVLAEKGWQWDCKNGKGNRD